VEGKVSVPWQAVFANLLLNNFFLLLIIIACVNTDRVGMQLLWFKSMTELKVWHVVFLVAKLKFALLFVDDVTCRLANDAL